MAEGGILGPNNPTSNTAASGVFRMNEHYTAVKERMWPIMRFGIQITGTSSSTWFPQDGPLQLTVGTYTLTPLYSFNNVNLAFWGAAGGSGLYQGSDLGNRGGAGGFAGGTISLNAGSVYTLVVGGGGQKGASSGAGAGGGYTGLFLTSTSQANALLIAGGGGGAIDDNVGYVGAAGGGGTTGQSGLGWRSSSNNATGGTQSAGGTAGTGGTSGSALTGGLGGLYTDTPRSTGGTPGGGGSGSNGGYGGGGGGGGYYGGGGGTGGAAVSTKASGGGGSGYYKSGTIGSPSLVGADRYTPGNTGHIKYSSSYANPVAINNGQDGIAHFYL